MGRQKIPKGTKKKLQQIGVSDATGADRIFFDNGGLNAWIAFLLTTEGQAHFNGRHNRSVTIAAFQQLPTADKAKVVKAVASKQPHPSVREAIRIMSKTFEDAGILDDRLNDLTHQRLSLAESSTGEANVSPQNNISNTPKNSLDPGASQHLVFESCYNYGFFY
ncbi:uncharacterized protein N7459_009453 [Penicillium hispanicum]|uniref:uncharacterized protein n=1 Tax=Penicillium hispanicum TaxID=1080232 RepID=UPI0025412F26|nr:uncharacterized protein N7459_009453 [Penicillium hispanicum]KAJ5570023.1 hypothetical protein N7459_009453 [Penicillium hispanicum]